MGRKRKRKVGDLSHHSFVPAINCYDIAGKLTWPC
jgi:hypothetical protein